MLNLLVASLVWAYSFGLIKHHLQGLDPNYIAWIRLWISFMVFLPVMQFRALGNRDKVALASIGAIQYGVMYLAYIHAFRYLAAYEVALFTVLTPLYVTAVNDVMSRRFHARFLLCAAFAVAGAAVTMARSAAPGGTLAGFALVQASNLCFAAGQVLYARHMGAMGEAKADRREPPLKDEHVFGWLYMGGVLLTGTAALFGVDWPRLHVTTVQTATLVYLGILPSGICFFLWNVAARRVNAGTLAVMNNAKIPLAVACSLLLFGEKASLPRLLVGGGLLLGAVLLNERTAAGRRAP